MTDQAVVWKLGFGALVLAFCALTVALRKPPPEVPQVPEAASVPAMMAAPAETRTEARPAAAPLDVQEDPPPTRIEVVLPKPKSVHKPAKRTIATRSIPPRIHRIVATRAVARPKADKAHYPYDPRDRWAWRERP
jgi:hypothetical protein